MQIFIKSSGRLNIGVILKPAGGIKSETRPLESSQHRKTILQSQFRMKILPQTIQPLIGWQWFHASIHSYNLTEKFKLKRVASLKLHIQNYCDLLTYCTGYFVFTGIVLKIISIKTYQLPYWPFLHSTACLKAYLISGKNQWWKRITFL